MEDDFGYTVRENELLDRMAAGELDGIVGAPLVTIKGEIFRLVIQSGIPTRYYEQPTIMILTEGKVERFLGTIEKINTWRTDDEKIQFLREYGDQINDAAVKEYVRHNKVVEPPESTLINWNAERHIYSPDTIGLIQ